MKVLHNRFFFLAAFGLLVSLMISEVLTRYLRQEHEQWQKTKSLWSEQIGLTRFHLAALLHDIGDDHLVLSNINLPNSLGRSLLGRVRPGELDQISIYDQHCRLISVGRERKRIKTECSPDQPEGFRGSLEHGVGVLSLVLKKKIQDQTLFFIGSVALDQEWLGLNPSLNLTMRRSGVFMSSTETNTSKHLTTESIGSKNQIFLNLNAEHLVKQWILKQLGNRPPENDIAWLFIVLLMAILFGWFGLGRLQETFRKKAMFTLTEQILAYHNALTKGKPIHIGEIPNLESEEWNLILKHVRDIIFAYQAIESDLNSRLKQLQSYWDRKWSVRNAQNQKSDLIPKEELRVAEKKIETLIADKIKFLASEIQSINLKLEAKIGPCVNDLKQKITGWEQGINTYSARKFIRSLSETRGTKPTSSQLDDDLLFLSQSSSTLDCEIRSEHTTLKQLSSIIEGLQWGLPIWKHSFDTLAERATPQKSFSLDEGVSKIEKLIHSLAPSHSFPPKLRFMNLDDTNFEPFFSSEWWALFLWQISWMLTEKKASKEILIRSKLNRGKPLISISFQQVEDPWLGQDLSPHMKKSLLYQWITTVDGFVSILLVPDDVDASQSVGNTLGSKGNALRDLEHGQKSSL